MGIDPQLYNRRQVIVSRITDAIKKICKIRIVLVDNADVAVAREVRYEEVPALDAAAQAQYPGAKPTIVVRNVVLIEGEDNLVETIRYPVIGGAGGGGGGGESDLLYDASLGPPTVDDNNNNPIATVFPTFSVTSDPEVISEISLDGTRLQRFFPILIQGFVPLSEEYNKYFDVVSGVSAYESMHLPADRAANKDLQRTEIERLRSAVDLLGEAYADIIVATLTSSDNVEIFNSAFSGDYCDGFSIERIGPVIVDYFENRDKTTLAFIVAQVQTSYTQNN